MAEQAMADMDAFLALEQRFWNAMKDRDDRAAMELSDDPTLVVGAQGAGEMPRQALGAMLRQSTWELLAFEIDSLVVREVAPGVVVTAYKVTEELSVEGAHLTLEAFDSSVWVKRNNSWVCSLHTESPAGDPFGRGRRTA